MILQIKRSWFCRGLMGVAIASVIGFPVVVQAQISVSPMLIRTETKQGQASSVISLMNSGSQPQRMRLYSEAFSYGRDGLETQVSDAADLTPYLIFSPKELILQPGQTRRIRLFVRLLPTMADGEYKSVLFAEPLREWDEQGGIRITARVGIVVYVTHGEVTFSLKPENAIYNAEQKQFELLVTNPGSGTVRPRGSWSLQRNGETIFQEGISTITVIAGGDRLIPLSLPEASIDLTPGTYQLTGELIWDNAGNTDTTPFSFGVSLP